MKSIYAKALLIFLFIIPVFTESYSKQKTNRYLNIGAGWGHMGLRDQGISPLYYSGNHLFITAGYSKVKDKYVNHLGADLLHGNITPTKYPDPDFSQMNSFRAGVSFSHMRSAGSFASNKVKIFLGGIIDSRFTFYEHNQFINSAKNNFSFSTLSLGKSFIYPFPVNGKQHKIELLIHMPVIALIVRPNHSYISPQGFLDHSTGNFQSVLNSIEVASLNRFFGLGSELSFKYQFRNNNALGIGYRWEYYGHENFNQLKTATHGIVLQTFF